MNIQEGLDQRNQIITAMYLKPDWKVFVIFVCGKYDLLRSYKVALKALNHLNPSSYKP